MAPLLYIQDTMKTTTKKTGRNPNEVTVYFDRDMATVKAYLTTPDAKRADAFRLAVSLTDEVLDNTAYPFGTAWGVNASQHGEVYLSGTDDQGRNTEWMAKLVSERILKLGYLVRMQEV